MSDGDKLRAAEAVLAERGPDTGRVRRARLRLLLWADRLDELDRDERLRDLAPPVRPSPTESINGRRTPRGWS